MGKRYDDYLKEHVGYVRKAADWLIEHYILTDGKTIEALKKAAEEHDKSKWGDDEYIAYDRYFYGDDGRTEEVKEEFNLAWLRHIHRNPHHWQHWVLIHDDDGTEAMEMPEWCVYEMIADWWSFSWKNGDLHEIFDWYADHSKGMILHNSTRNLVDNILDRIEKELNSEEDETEDNTREKHAD